MKGILMKIVTLILLLVIVLFAVAKWAFIIVIVDFFFGDGRVYRCDIESVETIQIIRIDGLDPEEHRYKYTVLCDVTDQSSFVERLNALEQSQNKGPPSWFDMGCVAILIMYANGDHDIIHHHAQRFYRTDSKYEGYGTGYRFFDEQQYYDLIERYYHQTE